MAKKKIHEEAAVTPKKPERPQNKNLRPLNTLPPEEVKKICSKGGLARQKQLRERLQLQDVTRAFLTLGTRDGDTIDPDQLTNVAQASTESIPVVMDIVLSEYKRYKLTGDKESRDFLLRMFNGGKPIGGEDLASGDGSTVPGEDIGGGVRIHLIRGERPVASEATNDTATRKEDVASKATTDGGGDA